MGRRLWVAAGGGGDAIGATMVARALYGDERPAILSYSWDRLVFDPVSGPRNPDDFDGLDPVGSHNFRVTGSSTAREPARSTLPRLAAELAIDLYLIDPRRGAVGLRDQLRELVDLLDVDEVMIVDVGGDILAHGDEPELRSPLADSLVLAAADFTDATVLVAGPGLDGELPVDLVEKRCRDLSDNPPAQLPNFDLEDIAGIFHWHPSEGSGLLWAAARGVEGRVEMRDHTAPMDLGPTSAAVWSLPAIRVLETNEIAERLRPTTRLDEAEAIVKHMTGKSELAYERRKAATLEPVEAPDAFAEALDRVGADARNRHADYVTVRRLAELLNALPDEAFRARLRAEITPLPAPALECPRRRHALSRSLPPSAALRLPLVASDARQTRRFDLAHRNAPVARPGWRTRLKL